MSVLKRGGVYWYEFQFMGQRILESAHTRNKDLAGSIERARRKALEESAGGVKRPRPLLFRSAGRTWLTANAHWSSSYHEINTLKLSHLVPTFGNMILTEITNAMVSKFQSKRLREGASGREINMETSVLRMILREHGLWHLLAPKFHPMPENVEVGRALTLEEVNSILDAAIKSRSRSLFPALMVYLHTGVRAAEGKIGWKQVDFANRTITVGHSKTRGGDGRVIPLNDEAFEILVEWHSRFKDPKPNHYVFPSERYGFDGHESHLTGKVAVYDMDPTKPMGSWKSAWTACRKAAGVRCRLHDLGHTFISALGETGVPDSTIKSIAGWMSAKMLERYSHTRNQAKRDAVNKLPRRRPK
jgi:integrase